MFYQYRTPPGEKCGLDPRRRAEAQSRVAAAESALHAAEQNVKSTLAEAELAEKELARLQPLYEKGYVSQGQLYQAAVLVRTTELQTGRRHSLLMLPAMISRKPVPHRALPESTVNPTPRETE
jgi:multidrug efflux pump subunit AcrA (membrane-fusion protein)